MAMKKISHEIQGGELLARKVGSGEVGIMIGYEVRIPQILDERVDKKTKHAIYWNCRKSAIADLEAVIAYFKSDEE